MAHQHKKSTNTLLDTSVTLNRLRRHITTQHHETTVQTYLHRSVGMTISFSADC